MRCAGRTALLLPPNRAWARPNPLGQRRTEDKRRMGRLVEKLHEVGQGSGAGLGFFAPARAAERKARPMGVLLIGGAGDVAALRAGVEAGADGVVLAGWTPGGSSFAELTRALGKDTVWGVEPGRDLTPDTLKAAAEAGASFAVLGTDVPAAALFGELEKFDLVATIEAPTDELGLLGLRAVNLLPVQAALVETRLSAGSLDRLSVADYLRLRTVVESVRFPSLLTVDGAVGEAEAKTLVQLGADAVVLSAASAGAALGQQVRALVAALEATPAPKRAEGGALLAGMLGFAGHQPSLPQPSPRPGKPAPEPEPEKE